MRNLLYDDGFYDHILPALVPARGPGARGGTRRHFGSFLCLRFGSLGSPGVSDDADDDDDDDDCDGGGGGGGGGPLVVVVVVVVCLSIRLDMDRFRI